MAGDRTGMKEDDPSPAPALARHLYREGGGMEDGPGLIALLTQLSNSFHRRSTEELLGMRLKEFLVLSYLRDHPATTQQELGEAMVMDPNAVVLLLNELES